MGRRAKKERRYERQAEAARPAPVSGVRRRWLRNTLRAAVVTAAAGLVGYGFWSGRGPAAVTPIDTAELSPQLKDYLPRFIEAVNDAPRDAARHAQLGLVYEANQYWAEALACFENAVRLDPTEPLARLHLAIVQLEMGVLDQALETLRELTLRFPDFAPGQHRLGTAALEAGNLPEAEAAFRRVIALSAGTHEGYIGLADVKIRRQDHAGARELLDKALELKPHDGTARHLLGLALVGLGREAEAQEHMAHGKNAGAILMVDAWSRTLPTHAAGLPRQNVRALALMNAGKLDEAAAVYQETLRWNPENPDLLNNLAIVRTRQGRLDDVLPLLVRAREANPSHHQTYSNLASYYYRRNELDRAIEQAAKALELAPRDASYHRKIASLLGKKGRNLEAREHYAAAAEYEPGNPLSFAKLAEVCLELGMHEEAQAALENAQRLAPNDPAVVAAAARFPRTVTIP